MTALRCQSRIIVSALVSAGGAEEFDNRTTEEIKHTKITFSAVSPLPDL